MALIKLAALTLLLGLSSLFWFLFYVQYYQWRNCFDEGGRCFDVETSTVYHEQSGMVYLMLAAITSVLSLYGLWRFYR